MASSKILFLFLQTKIPFQFYFQILSGFLRIQEKSICLLFRSFFWILTEPYVLQSSSLDTTSQDQERHSSHNLLLVECAKKYRYVGWVWGWFTLCYAECTHDALRISKLVSPFSFVVIAECSMADGIVSSATATAAAGAAARSAATTHPAAATATTATTTSLA
jgi:hypothetical protein